MKKITILGVTGSIGTQTLDVMGQDYELACVSAHHDVDALIRIAKQYRPQYVALTGEGDVTRLKQELGGGVKIIMGENALREACLAGEPDMVMLAVSGIAGLPAFEQCLMNHIPVALANKESLVCGAQVTQALIRETKTPVLPVDSEHAAIFQCLGNRFDAPGVRKLWITASGGPFLHWSKEEIALAPLEKALKHPRWSMGRKITIDSASLANKGLEVIEAHYMYHIAPEDIMVLIQPQSLIHSMVEFEDCSVLAQLGPVDMRLAIQKALAFPEMKRYDQAKPLDFYEIAQLDFLKPDMQRFPCLALAYEAIRTATTAVFNVANEVAVERYVGGGATFGDIPRIIEASMSHFAGEVSRSVADVMELDRAVRVFAQTV